MTTQAATCDRRHSDDGTRLDKLNASIGDFRYLPNGSKYHEGEEVLYHLNNQAPGVENWTFRVLEHGRDEESDELWVYGEMTVIFWTPDPNDPQTLVRSVAVHQDFGGQQIKRSRKTQLPQSLTDDRKAALTDCIKRCARQIGVGLDAWAKRDRDAPQTSYETPYRRSEEEEEARASVAPVTSQPAPSRVNGASETSRRPKPAAPAPLSTSERAAAENAYQAAADQAVDLGYRAGWLDTPMAKHTDVQLVKYTELLTAEIARRSQRRAS